MRCRAYGRSRHSARPTDDVAGNDAMMVYPGIGPHKRKPVISPLSPFPRQPVGQGAATRRAGSAASSARMPRRASCPLAARDEVDTPDAVARASFRTSIVARARPAPERLTRGRAPPRARARASRGVQLSLHPPLAAPRTRLRHSSRSVPSSGRSSSGISIADTRSDTTRVYFSHSAVRRGSARAKSPDSRSASASAEQRQ